MIINKNNSSNKKYNLNIVDGYNNYEAILNNRFFYFLNLFPLELLDTFLTFNS